MILAIDFDDTICDSLNVSPGKKMGSPIPGSKEKLLEYQKQGHMIIIHTARGSNPGHIEDWMKFYGIPFDGIVNKFRADVYIDDKGRHFTGWDQDYL